MCCCWRLVRSAVPAAHTAPCTPRAGAPANHMQAEEGRLDSLAAQGGRTCLTPQQTIKSGSAAGAQQQSWHSHLLPRLTWQKGGSRALTRDCRPLVAPVGPQPQGAAACVVAHVDLAAALDTAAFPGEWLLLCCRGSCSQCLVGRGVAAAYPLSPKALAC